jgi:hypothetical protein
MTIQLERAQLKKARSFLSASRDAPCGTRITHPALKSVIDLLGASLDYDAG